jgi:hypothetical protein
LARQLHRRTRAWQCTSQSHKETRIVAPNMRPETAKTLTDEALSRQLAAAIG